MERRLQLRQAQNQKKIFLEELHQGTGKFFEKVQFSFRFFNSTKQKSQNVNPTWIPVFFF